MRPLIPPFLSLLFLLFLGHHFSPAAATTHRPDIIIETCKRCSDSSPNVNFDRCVRSLGSVPNGHRSDLRGLGLIAVKLAIANATHARREAKKLLNAKPQDRYMRSCLKTCVELYTDAISSLKDSAKAIKLGRYNDANVQVSSAVDAPGDCEDSFTEGSVESPLVEVDDDFFQLAVIALGIVALLQ